MSQLLFNHPHRDCYNGNIVIPVRLHETHAGQLIIWKYPNEDTENVMSISSWERYCVPVIFHSEEGP